MIKGQIVSNWRNYGNIGEFAFEYNDEKYYIGDVCNINTDNEDYGNEFVVRDERGCFIMSIAGDTYNGNIRGLNYWNVKKVKSYTTLKDGENVGGLIAKIEYINHNRRIIKE